MSPHEASAQAVSAQASAQATSARAGNRANDARHADNDPTSEHVETIVIGAGQAGLSVGHHLAERSREFVILDAAERVGDAWRNRWDSLRLFTPARYDGLDGMPFPAQRHHFPTKDEMADYLETYAREQALPVRTGTRVQRLARDGGDRFVLTTDRGSMTADNVVVAMSTYGRPKVPAFAGELRSGIVQLHSSRYRRPSQLQDGGVLLVGAGNSAAEIAVDVSNDHEVWMAGRDTGHIPFRIEGSVGRRVGVPFVVGFLFHHVLTVSTPMGRKARPVVLSRGGPLIRTRPSDLRRIGVERVGRVTGVRDGLPLLEDGRTLEVRNVVWCTGFRPSLDWIDLPIHGEHEPLHERGVVATEPGLYFVGLEFLTALSSTMVRGVGRDAEHIATHLHEHTEGRRPVNSTSVARR